MKIRSLIIVLGIVVAFIIGCRRNQEVHAMISLSTQTQWFDFSQNQKCGVVGFHTGLVGYRGDNDISDMNLSNLALALVMPPATSMPISFMFLQTMLPAPVSHSTSTNYYKP